MNSKTNKLWLPLILVIALALTFGLVMSYAPTAQSANADIGDQVNVPWEGVMNSYIYVSEIDSENVYVRIRENYEWVESGNPKDPLMHPYYDFSAAGYDCQTDNEKFQYSISTNAQDFVNHLWTIEINSSSDFTGDDYLADENFDLKAYYASYDVMQDKPEFYATPNLAISNHWCVVLCDGDDSNPIAYATIYMFDCPFVWKDAPMTFSEVTGEIIMSALHDTGDNAYAQLKGDASGNRLCGYLYQKDSSEQYARMGYDGKYSSTFHDKSELLPVGTYIIDMYWDSDPNYADGEAYIQFEVLPKVINASYSASDAVRTYGDESLPAPNALRNYDDYLMEYTDPVDYAKIVWYYYDGSEDGAPLPTGLDLYPGEYSVWPQLVEYKYEYGWWVVDPEAHNCELGTISWNGTALSKEGTHGTLTIEAIDISTALAAASFTGLTYGDAASFAFRTNANTALTTALADATANWGDVDIEINWYYVLKVEGEYDFDTHYPFNEWVSAGTYAVRYEVVGERAAGVTGALTKTGEGGFFDDEAPIRLTIAKKAIEDVTVYLGTEEKNGALSMYTGSTPVANTLYYSPMGLQFFVKSMSNPEVKFVFDGWKKNANDDEEEPTLDISEQIDKTYYVYNIHAVKNVGGEWVKDDNYNITLRNCQVTIAKRIIYISPNMDYLYYNGEEQIPEFDILGTDLYLNPNETAATEFEVGENKWIILEQQQNNLKIGTNAGSDYVYGVQVIDDSKYAIAWMPDGSDLHTSYSWNYEILHADPTLTLTEKEDWYHYEEVPGDAFDEMLEYLLTYKFTFDYETAQESDVIEISAISWSDDGVYWYTLGAADPITLANSVSLGKGNTLRFQVMTAGTDNYAPSHVDINFEIQSAPIYLIYDEEDVTFGAPDTYAYSVEWSDFGVEMYRKGSGIDPRARDNTHFPGTAGFYINSLVSYVEGKNDSSSIYCGEHVFELKLNNEEKGYLANGEVHWTIAWTEITVEKFDLPSGFVYGGDNGNSYYQAPYIDYRASSRAEAYVPTYDTYFQMSKTYYTEAAGVYTPAEVTVGDAVPADTYYEYQYCEIIGKATGFGTIPDSYKWPVEVWEFTTDEGGALGALYEGEWTTWDEFNYPKDAGTYYVRYSAKFYNASSYADTEYVDGWGYKTVVSDELLARGSAAIGYQYGSFTIVPKEITLNWTGNNVEYTGVGQQAQISATLAYGENVADEITYTNDYFTDYKEGGYDLTATVNDNALGNKNYTITNSTAKMNIYKVKVTVTAEDWNNIPYGSEKPTLTYTITGFVNDEDEESLRATNYLTGSPALSVEYVRYESGVGHYTITCAEGTIDAKNYTFEFVDGDLEIVKANLAPSIAQNKTVVFTGTPLTSQGAVAINYGTFSGEAEEGYLITYSKTASDYINSLPSWTDADTYTVYYKITSDNYNDYEGSYEFTISNATITGSIEPTNAFVIYDSSSHGGSDELTNTIATVGGMEKSTRYKVEGGSYDGNIPTFKDAGTYKVWYEVTAANHDTLEYYYNVVIKPIQITYDFKIDGSVRVGDTIESNGSDHTVSATPTNVFTADSGKVAIEVTGDVTKNTSGTYTATLTITGDKKNNYTFDDDNGAQLSTTRGWGIGIAQFTNVTVAQNGTLTYTGEAQEVLFTISYDAVPKDVTILYSLNGTDWVSKLYATDACENTDAWIKLTAEDYTDYVVETTFSVGKADLELSVTAPAGKTYDGAAVAAAIVSGNVSGGAQTVLYQMTAPTAGDAVSAVPSAAGTYKVIYSVEATDNYNGASVESATFTIAQKSVEVNFTSDLVYNGLSQKPVASIKGAIEGDDVSVAWANTVTKNADDYDNIGFSFVGDDAANYTTDSFEHSFSIAQKEITLSWKIDALDYGNQHVTYDGGNHGVTVSAETGVDGETVTVPTYGDKANLSLAGTYTAYVGDDQADVDFKAKGSTAYNYIIYTDTENREFTWYIDNATITDITLTQADVAAFIYNGQKQQPTVNKAATTVNGQVYTFHYNYQNVVDKNDASWSTDVPTEYQYVDGTNVLYYYVTAPNHTDSGSFMLDIVMKPMPVTVTFSEETLTYNGENQKPALVGIDVVDADKDYVSTQWLIGSTIAAGNYNNSGYALVGTRAVNYTCSGKHSFSIQPKELTLSWTLDNADKTKVTYDGNAHSVTVSAATGVGTETITVTTAGTLNATNSGNYTAYVEIQSYKADGVLYDYNYKVSENNENRVFNWAIDKAELTIAALGDLSTTYGTAVVEPTIENGGIVISGWGTNDSVALIEDDMLQVGYAPVVGDVMSVDEILAAIAAGEIEFDECPTNAGTYYVGVRLLGLANYEDAYQLSTFTIAQKALTITADDKAVTYGNAAPEFTVSYDGFVYGEKESVLGGVLAVTTAYQVGDAAGGTHAIVPSGLTSANYDITFESGTLTVEKRPITVDYNGTEPIRRVYGDASIYTLDPAGFVTVSDGTLADGDTLDQIFTVTISPRDRAQIHWLTAINGSNFGYAATYYLVGFANQNSGNYEVTNALMANDNACLVISPAALTITADNKQVVYGEATPAFTVTYNGLKYNDATKLGEVFTGKLEFECKRDLTSDVGSYQINPHGVTAGNYTITFVNGNLSVNYANLEVEVEVTNTVYGTAVKAPAVDDGITVTGWKNGQTAKQLVTADKLTIYYILKEGNKTFDEMIDVVDAEFFKMTEDEQEAYTASLKVIPTAAGTYYVYVQIDGIANYADHAQAYASFTIAKKALTITADDKEITYGDYAPEYTVSFDGFVYGEDAKALGGTLAFTCDYKQFESNPGTLDIEASGYTSANYAITFEKGTLTVKAGEFAAVEVKEDGNVEVTIDATAASGEEGVNINKIIEQAAKAGDNAGATLNVGTGSIVLDAAAVQALKDQDVVLTLTTKTGDDANTAVKGAKMVMEISLGATFDGAATVTMPYTEKVPGGKKAVVYYVDKDGKKTDMNATFEDGTVKFTTTHFSTYVVEYKLTGGSIAGIVIACVVGAAAVAVGVFFFLKKKKAGAQA